MTPDDIVRKARSLIGKPCKYLLGGGGRDPHASHPATRVYDSQGRLLGVGSDCIGFVAWASGFDRFQRAFPYYGGWINCDSALGRWDGLQWQPAPGWFTWLPAPEVGCWIVYPSVDLNHDGHRDRIGHVAIVSEVAAKGWSWSTTKVVHCSYSQSVRTDGKAVAETTAEIWGRAELFRGQKHKRWGAAFLRPVVNSRAL